MERERVRESEPGQRQGEHYESTLRLTAQARERTRTGKIVIKANERPWSFCTGSFSLTLSLSMSVFLSNAGSVANDEQLYLRLANALCGLDTIRVL